MKTTAKITYLLSGALTIISSCSHEESPVNIPSGSDRRIVFHTSLPELTTKASEIVTDLGSLNLTAFDESDADYIVGGKLTEYFKNEKIEKSARSEMFVSDRCIWPEPGQESDLLHFFAYYPEHPSESLVNGTTAGDGNVTLDYSLKNFKVATDIADQVDFVTAYTSGSMENNLFSGINLNFRHQLSRIEVTAKSSHKSCRIEIAGIGFGGAGIEGTFGFQTSGDADGKWTEISKGYSEYVFRQGDQIITAGADPVSVSGSTGRIAMLIPDDYEAWEYDSDATNTAQGLYLNVLLRVLDKTPGGNNEQQYPYFDNSQGLNALNIPVVLVPVDNEGKNIIGAAVQVYKGADGTYYTDKEKKNVYTLSQGTTVKEFGWAAVPVSGSWEPGKIYTYTLDYTYGVGVHGPEAPMAGDPIISDRVGVTLGFKDWVKADLPEIEVPGN